MVGEVTQLRGPRLGFSVVSLPPLNGLPGWDPTPVLGKAASLPHTFGAAKGDTGVTREGLPVTWEMPSSAGRP